MVQRRVSFFQPALPAYRIDFFDRLAKRLGERFALYYSPTPMGVLTEERRSFGWERPLGLMQPLLPGTEWQPGALKVPIARGDTIIVCGGPRTLSTLALLLKARLKGAKSIWFGHYWSSTSKRHRFILRILLMRLAHAVLFYTDQEIAEYRARMGRHDKRPISAVNNGINVDPIVPLRAPYRAGARPLAALFIGRLTEKSRLDLAIEALTDPKLRDVRLHVIGGGPIRAALARRAEDLGLADRVEWHGATVREKAISLVANRCRLFVYPGEVGLSLIHAMAYGLPAIITNNRWANNPEITAFSHGETGWSFEEDNARDLATKWAEMISDEAALDRCSEEAIRRADHSFNTRLMAERVARLVAQLEGAEA
jgi:glycosyltransferase involved in cell wall biosynthesis